MNSSSVVVNKPWGYEYLMFQNETVGLWFLRLRPGASTSLHCHPRKKTGLVMLSGEGELSFLNNSTRLMPLTRSMIRPGLFHATKALSPEGIALLEIETPPEKENLVRLEDKYGREEESYEGPEWRGPLPADFLRFAEVEVDKPQEFRLEGCTLRLLKTMSPASLDISDKKRVLLVLQGGLFSEGGEPILSAGDVVSPPTIGRLVKRFTAPQGITLLTITRP